MLGIEYLILRITFKIIFFIFLFVIFKNSNLLFIIAIIKERSLKLTFNARNYIKLIILILNTSWTFFKLKIILLIINLISLKYLLIS
jgi:hypothetical protein